MSRHPGRVAGFADLRAELVDIVSDVVYATMTTVDRRGRPRARVLITAWDVRDDGLTGWLATFRTPVKTAHLAANPHVGMSYWSPRQDVAAVDSVAEWVDDDATKRDVWSLYRRGGPPGVGYDPGAYWRGPGDPRFHVLRLVPYRVQVMRGRDLATGRPSRIWVPSDGRASPEIEESPTG